MIKLLAFVILTALSINIFADTVTPPRADEKTTVSIVYVAGACEVFEGQNDLIRKHKSDSYAEPILKFWKSFAKQHGYTDEIALAKKCAEIYPQFKLIMKTTGDIQHE